MQPTPDTQPPTPDQQPGALAAVGAVLLVAALVFGVMWAWRQPDAIGTYNLGRAGGLLAESRYTEAASLLEEVVKYHPTARTRLLLSEAYLELRDAERAETQARLALGQALPHGRAAAWTQLGRSLAGAGKGSEAIGAWEQARKEGRSYAGDPQVEPHIRAATWLIARQHWLEDDYEAARPYLEELSGGDDPYGAGARLQLAQLSAPSDPQQSLSYLNPTNLTPHSALRIPHSDGVPQSDDLNGRVDALKSAHEEAEKAREDGAGEAALAALWGTALVQQGEPVLAKAQLEPAVTLDPQSAGGHERLALALVALGDSDGAERHLRSAIQLGPDSTLARRMLAGIYMARKDWEAVDTELDALDRLLPGSVEPHLARAEFLALLGAYDEAAAEYEEAAAIQRRAATGVAGQDASLAAARFYIDMQGGEPACSKGLPHAQDSLRQRPDNAATLDMVGWGLMLCRKPQEAVGVLERAVAIAPRSARYRYHLARAYSDLGRREEALHQLTRVSDLDPGGPWERLAITERVRVERDTDE